MWKKTALCVMFLQGLLFPLLQAQTAAGQTAPKRWQFTFLERVREESWDNVTSLTDTGTDSSAFLRVKTSLGFRWQATGALNVVFKVSNEFRYYISPKTDMRVKKNFDLHELFVDQIYLQWQKPFSLPLKITAGRQDMQFGEGFLVLDGSPLDGSRSTFFNGIRLDWDLGRKNTLTGFYVKQPRLDTVLPIINDVNQGMIEQAEEGFGVYFSGLLRKTVLDAFLMRKNVCDYQALPESGITVLGARFQHPFSARLSLTGEGAWQTGTYGEMKRRALGGYFHLDFQTKLPAPLPTQLVLGGIYLSGDDRGTPDRYEGWDPFFARWPKWSDSFIYLLVREDRVAFWTNLTSLYGGAVWQLLPPLKFSLHVHRLGAAERTGSSAFLSGAGLDRGLLVVARLQLDVNRNLSGHFIWESLRPGNYYFPGARSYAWLRFEFQYKL
jgi:hypothetical protein